MARGLAEKLLALRVFVVARRQSHGVSSPLRGRSEAHRSTASTSGSLRAIQASIMARVRHPSAGGAAYRLFSLAGVVSAWSALVPQELVADPSSLRPKRIQLREARRARARAGAKPRLPRRVAPGRADLSACVHVTCGVSVAPPAVAECPLDAAARAGAAGRVRSRLAAFCRWFVCENAPAAWVLGFERALHDVVCVRACVRARFP